MRKLPQIFLTSLAILGFTVGCSSPAQTPQEGESEAAASIGNGDGSTSPPGGGGGESTATTAIAPPVRRVAITPQLEPGFIKVSRELREAVGSIGSAQAAQSIELLQAVRKNIFLPAHDKQLAAYLLADLVGKQAGANSGQEAIKLYVEAAGHEPLATPARMHAADIAAAATDEKNLQEVLSPLVGKAEALARIEREKAKAGAYRSPAKKDPALPEALYRLAESYYRAKDYGPANNVFERVRDYFPETEFATGSSYYLGVIALETAGDWKTAQKEFRHYLNVCPQGKNAIKIIQLMIDACQPKPSTTGDPNVTVPALIELTPNDRAMIAMALYKHGRHQDALDTWSQIDSKHIYRAVSLMKTGKRQEGVTALLQAVEANPKDPNIQEVTSAFCVPVSTKEALALWQEVLKRNPEKIDVALWNVAKRLGAPQGASYYQRLITERPTSEFAPESAWWLVWSSAKQAYASAGPNRKIHFTRALDHCQKAIKAYSHTHIGPKFAFWRGKLHEAVGQKAPAIAAYEYAELTYPGSYYGYRSKFRGRHLRSEAAVAKKGATVSGAPPEGGGLAGAHAIAGASHVIPDRKWSTVPGRACPDPNWTWPEPPDLFQWSRMPHTIGDTAAVLMWLRQYDDCFKHATGKVPSEVKGWVLFKQGQILKAGANASWKLEGYPHKNAHWRFAYPLAYGTIVERESKKRNVDPLLIHGLIRQESRYDHKAVSRSNAMGLMQLLKGTAYGVAKNNGITLNSTQDIFTPDTNIQLGTAYIAYVLKRAEGNPMIAVASYNGGPNAAARWLRQYQAAGISDMDAYVEDIPYNETRDYVRKVFAHYWNYEHLYLHKVP